MHKKLFDDALELWGEDAQIGMLMEECAELIQAANRLQRARITVEDFASEVADVEIMCAQMRRIVGDQAVDSAKLQKLARLSQTIKAATS